MTHTQYIHTYIHADDTHTCIRTYTHMTHTSRKLINTAAHIHANDTYDTTHHANDTHTIHHANDHTYMYCIYMSAGRCVSWYASKCVRHCLCICILCVLCACDIMYGVCVYMCVYVHDMCLRE